LLKVEDLYVGYYKDLNILQGVNVNARKAEITVVLGANGVGKSTLLKAIYGFIHPQQGKIEVDGQDILHLASHELVHHGVSYIPQRQSIFPYMTVEENMELGAWSFRSDKARVQQKLEDNFNGCKTVGQGPGPPRGHTRHRYHLDDHRPPVRPATG
jgi:branched-chain amino acid transport system ATP-binding protein